MNFQSRLRQSKQLIRAWVGAKFSDQKLASVTAFNEDGKMSFRSPCACLMGVTYSDGLHTDQNCNHDHYWRARRHDLVETSRWARLFSSSGMGRVEKAYLLLGFSSECNSCFGDDDVRRRRFSALLRAEMRRRDRESALSREQSLPLHPVNHSVPAEALR